MKASIVMLVAVLLFGCNRKATSAAIEDTGITASSLANTGGKISAPACILAKIDSIKKQPRWNPPAEIYEYEYNGRKVYVISAPCCDFFTTAVDANCNYICAPAGGFTGRGDRKCADFFTAAKQIRLVWKDDRGK